MNSQEVQIKGFTFTITWTHTGQYRPYGDSFYVANIVTSCKDESTVIEAMRVADSHMPKYSKKEWDAMHKDAGTYFAGWYQVEPIPEGWKYTECKPYTD